MDRYSLRFGSAITQNAYDEAYARHLHLGHEEAARRALVEAMRAKDRFTAVVGAGAALA